MSVYESDLSRLVDELNRSMPGTKTDRTSLDTLLGLAAEQDASDVILVAGSAIML
jgi:twitching motility protein PilT